MVRANDLRSAVVGHGRRFGYRLCRRSHPKLHHQRGPQQRQQRSDMELVAARSRKITGVSNANFQAVWGSGPGDVYVLNVDGTIAHTIDSGASWSQQALHPPQAVSSIWGSGPNDIYVGGDSGLLYHGKK